MHRILLAILGALALPQSAAAADLPPRIVMMWQVTGRDYTGDFRQLKQMGVNVAQSFALAGMDPAYVDGYFKAAEAAGIGVVAFVGGLVEGSDAGCALSAAGESFVRTHTAAPALLAWHTVDEPVNHRITRACQRRLYERVKSLDPRHPVLVSINFTKQREYDEYFEERAFDILDLHRYVNPDVGPAQQRLIDLFRQNRNREYRVIVTLRAFDAPQKVRRQSMPSGTLDSQYEYFFKTNRIGDDIGFYGWRLAPNLGISQIDWLKAEFGRLANEKLAVAPNE
jgi:hypothetical protein